jgi:hypothetical protein
MIYKWFLFSRIKRCLRLSRWVRVHSFSLSANEELSSSTLIANSLMEAQNNICYHMAQNVLVLTV